MSILFLPSLLPPPAWWQKRYCILYITEHGPGQKISCSLA